jgi:hypothetical protein
VAHALSAGTIMSREERTQRTTTPTGFEDVVSGLIAERKEAQ